MNVVIVVFDRISFRVCLAYRSSSGNLFILAVKFRTGICF
jgi:hypothetical protein